MGNTLYISSRLSKGTGDVSITDEFSEKFQRGRGGHLQSKPLKRARSMKLKKKLPHDFLKMSGRSKAAWNENSAVLETPPVPKGDNSD